MVLQRRPTLAASLVVCSKFIKKCMGEYGRVLKYCKLIEACQVKAQNKCKPASVVVYCRFCQISQIHCLEPQKRQHTTTEVGLHLF